MKITPVSEVLGSVGLEAPTLAILTPNVNSYSALLLQPQGEIEASVAGVRNKDPARAQTQFGAFLADVKGAQPDLAVTPEYSMPWDVLTSVLKAGVRPELGKLWAFGCESITVGELATIRDNLSIVATVLFEAMPTPPKHFTDPLVYVFIACDIAKPETQRVVVLVQFKTFPMADSDNFETSGLLRGTQIYMFGGAGHDLKLISLICSDALNFMDGDAEKIYDRALVLHIQLNPKPRHEQFRRYRDRLLQYKGDATELICLNWASNVQEWCNGKAKAWNNVGGSAWYLRPTDFDDRDETLQDNHQRGLYYTWLPASRAHALFFNYAPGTYLLEATKVAHIGVPAVSSRRRGPQLRQRCTWDDSAKTWSPATSADDGFADVVGECGNAQADIRGIAEMQPIAAERLLALCAGAVANHAEWYSVRRLDSFSIELSEIIKRLTFCQDSDVAARDFRVARLRRCATLWDILTFEDLPPALADLKNKFVFQWSVDHPHHNVISEDGNRASVIYMGEECSPQKVDQIARIVAEFLHRASADANASLAAKQRLAVWYRTNGAIMLHTYPDACKFTQGNPRSAFDIGREI